MLLLDLPVPVGVLKMKHLVPERWPLTVAAKAQYVTVLVGFLGRSMQGIFGL